MLLVTSIQKIAAGRDTNSVTCEATSENEILFVFSAPVNAVSLGQRIKLDPELYESTQDVSNLDSDAKFRTVLRKENVHDVRLPAKHGGSRFPAAGRFNAA